MNAAREGRLVPGLAFHALTPLYDRALRLMFDDVALKRRFLDQAGLAPGRRVLDLGCGTGTLLLLLRGRGPGCPAFGVDGDRAMAARARWKLGTAAGAPQVAVAWARTLPFADGSFDRLLSTLFFHHLPTAAKPTVLQEVHRVLRPGGELHVMDFASPSGWWRRAVFTVLRVFDGLDNTADNAAGLLPKRMQEAGFEDIQELARVDTLVGTVAHYRARRP
jgi:ubiquinone/menaquinone biosynthesis C-methylase UbiE